LIISERTIISQLLSKPFQQQILELYLPQYISLPPVLWISAFTSLPFSHFKCAESNQ